MDFYATWWTLGTAFLFIMLALSKDVFRRDQRSPHKTRARSHPHLRLVSSKNGSQRDRRSTYGNRRKKTGIEEHL